MAGHSHWAGIKHKKAINDKKKGKVFSKLAKLITTAVMEGKSGNPDDNPRLRLVLDKCRLANMTNDVIKRAIDKATGTGAAAMETIIYEGYGFGGAAVIVECMTDNGTRTVAEVRHAFNKQNARLGNKGCVMHQFSRKGIINIDKDQINEDKLMDLALEAGAEDVVDQDTFYEISCDPQNFVEVSESLQKAGLTLSDNDVQLVPMQKVELGLEDAQKMMKFIEALEELDDVQNVYHNFDVSQEVAESLAKEE